jgi:Flp pilus assembly protein CpaB
MREEAATAKTSLIYRRPTDLPDARDVANARAEGKPVTVQVVNLLVTPEQAEKLSLASSDTKIQLVLRNPLDTETTKTPGTALAYILQGSAPAKPQPKPAAAKAAPRPPAPPTVEIITGSRKGSGPSQSSMRNLSK